jgi:hypothetical protein
MPIGDDQENTSRLLRKIGMYQDWKNLLCQLGCHGSSHNMITYPCGIVLAFGDTLIETLANAIEHGTHFCSDGNVNVVVTYGENGVLGIVSQPTPGITHQVALGNETLDINKASSGRCKGLLSLRDTEFGAPRVWFEFTTKDKPGFAAIILSTREQLAAVSEDYVASE